MQFKRIEEKKWKTNKDSILGGLHVTTEQYIVRYNTESPFQLCAWPIRVNESRLSKTRFHGYDTLNSDIARGYRKRITLLDAS